MRIPGRDPAEGLNMEFLIKKTLDEHVDGASGDIVERIAERIARGRAATGRPRALKRHETV
jgi:serine/threonine-protein phosphatase 2B catalytic subunit